MFEVFGSGTFWSAVAALAAVVAVVVGVITFRAQFPRRRLSYGLRSTTRLLTTHAGVSDLEVRQRDRVLRDPHVVEVVLIGRGRRDISSNLFDQDKPIRLSLGVPIVEVLDVSGVSAPDSYVVLEQEGVLTLGPCLIGRRQRIMFSLLLDGKPELTCHHNLIDIEVRESDDAVGSGPSRTERVGTAIGLTGTVVGAAGMLLDQIFIAILALAVLGIALGMLVRKS